MTHGARERGVVTLEFLIAIVPILLVVLGAVQLLLLGATRVVVAHAAVAAARSAAVVLDDDPDAYGGEPRGHLGDPQRASPSASSPGVPGSAGGGIPSLALLSGGRTRLDVIRRAASAPLAALAPSPTEVARWLRGEDAGSLADAVGGAPLLRARNGISFYDRAALSLQVAHVPDGASRELVTARVTYLAHCAVPIVSALICRHLAALVESDPAAGRALAAVPAPDVTRALGGTGQRFLVLTAAASYPRQRASYPGATGG